MTGYWHRRSVPSMRRFYNRIRPIYSIIEMHLGPKLDVILREKMAALGDTSSMTALEYACGSGLLTLKLAPYFQSVTGRDLSSGMLRRARQRATAAGAAVSFREGNILAIDEPAGSCDYVFVSFALHLFSPTVERDILRHLFRLAKKKVIIIDHSQQWEGLVALVEWVEGSHYDQYLTVDFNSIAREMGCASFEALRLEDCAVMTFSH